MPNSGPSAHSQTRASWVLAGAAALLGTAFVVAPVWLAGGEHGGGFFGDTALSNSAANNFVAFWRTGGEALPAGMNDLVDYWMRYHVAKAVAAGLLMVVLAVLATRLWRVFTSSEVVTRRRRVAGAAGVTATAGGLAAAVLLMANVQGAIAPLSSVLSLVPTTSDSPAVGQAQTQVAEQLQARGAPTPALARMINDFGTYHAVLAVSAVVMACAAMTISVVVARSFLKTSRSDRPLRRKKSLTSAAFAIVGIGVFVLAAANIGNATDPARALLLFYTG